MSTQPLSDVDTQTVLAAIRQMQRDGRVVEAVEVNPQRRSAAGAWRISEGVDLVSNGVVPVDRFTLKVRGRTFRYDDITFLFTVEAQA